MTKLAIDLATSISHFSEISGIKARDIFGKECLYNQLMIDIAYMSKHGELRKQDRENKISVQSSFEYIEPDKFKFLRNQIIIEHQIMVKVILCKVHYIVFFIGHNY